MEIRLLEQLPPKKVDAHLMIHIPAQSVQLGHDGFVPYDEQPEWYETLDSFYITQTEITNADFVRFLNEADLTPQQVIQILGFKETTSVPVRSSTRGNDFDRLWSREKFPVATVTYDGAEAYCDWVNMRLPSEAEWVAAIRGGTKTLYPWGETATLEDANWGREWKGYMPTTEVGSFQPNAYGVYDGMGNVWEWTSTQYLPYDGRTVSTDRKERKVLRGGDWFVQPSDVSVYTRLALEPQGAWIDGWRRRFSLCDGSLDVVNVAMFACGDVETAKKHRSLTQSEVSTKTVRTQDDWSIPKTGMVPHMHQDDERLVEAERLFQTDQGMAAAKIFAEDNSEEPNLLPPTHCYPQC